MRSDALSQAMQDGSATPSKPGASKAGTVKSGTGKPVSSYSSKPRQDKPASVGGFGALLVDALKKK